MRGKVMRFGVMSFIGRWLDADSLPALAREVEALGYHSLWAADHTVIPVRVDSRYPYSRRGRSPYPPDIPWWEPITTLSYLAAITERVLLGTGVLVLPHRNPVLTAKMLSQVQILSRGRLLVGVGVGWMREEAHALGSPWRQRGAMADEQIQLMRELWAHEFPTFRGRFYQVEGVGFGPLPPEPPPILVGGHAIAALRRAAYLGDGWLAFALPPDQVARRWQLVQEMAAEAGRDPQSLTLGVIAPLVITERPLEEARPIMGTPEQVQAMVGQYRDVGVQHLVVAPPIWLGRKEALDTITLFAQMALGDG
jgi:probable F420-dependent oxidoreductase